MVSHHPILISLLIRHTQTNRVLIVVIKINIKTKCRCDLKFHLQQMEIKVKSVGYLWEEEV